MIPEVNQWERLWYITRNFASLLCYWLISKVIQLDYKMPQFSFSFPFFFYYFYKKNFHECFVVTTSFYFYFYCKDRHPLSSSVLHVNPILHVPHLIFSCRSWPPTRRRQRNVFILYNIIIILVPLVQYSRSRVMSVRVRTKQRRPPSNWHTYIHP